VQFGSAVDDKQKKSFSIVQQLLLTSAFTWFLHAWVSAFFLFCRFRGIISTTPQKDQLTKEVE